MSRTLGEGVVIKMVKKYAYIRAERIGDVFFPLAAATVVSNDCSDLREKFEINDMVIFTAAKQAQSQNGCNFVASAVVKRRELITCSGKISETSEKYCYADVRKYGRVFVPHSSRTGPENSKLWLGRGAEKDKPCQLKIFRQPDINNCRYVAWEINMADQPADDAASRNGQLRGAERQPESAQAQTGVIVLHPTNGDSMLYSAKTGLARLPITLREPWMSLGRFVNYDVIKLNTNEAKLHWIAKNCKDQGEFYKVVNDYMDESKLFLEVEAVVNRISVVSRAAWLWNDFIGRIYVPPACFVRGLKAMTSVHIRAVYTGAFEDVPWSAVKIAIIGDDEDVRNKNSQLLITDDNWVVKFIHPQQNTFYGFMDNPKYGSAFIAWTDLTNGDTPPDVGAKCRATVYHQQRDRKHAWRAVLVTPFDADGQPESYHPIHTHTGEAFRPHPLVAPVEYDPPTSALRRQDFPVMNGGSPMHNGATVQQHQNNLAGANGVVSQAGSNGTMSHAVVNGGAVLSGPPPGLPAATTNGVNGTTFTTTENGAAAVNLNSLIGSALSNGNNGSLISSTTSPNGTTIGSGVDSRMHSAAPTPPLSSDSPVAANSPRGAFSEDSVAGQEDDIYEYQHINVPPLYPTATGWTSIDFLSYKPPADTVWQQQAVDGPALSNGRPLAVHSPFHPLVTAESVGAVGEQKKSAIVDVQTDVFFEQQLLKDIFRKPELRMEILNAFPEHHEKIFQMRWMH